MRGGPSPYPGDRICSAIIVERGRRLTAQSTYKAVFFGRVLGTLIEDKLELAGNCHSGYSREPRGLACGPCQRFKRLQEQQKSPPREATLQADPWSLRAGNSQVA